MWDSVAVAFISAIATASLCILINRRHEKRIINLAWDIRTALVGQRYLKAEASSIKLLIELQEIDSFMELPDAEVKLLEPDQSC